MAIIRKTKSHPKVNPKSFSASVFLLSRYSNMGFPKINVPDIVAEKTKRSKKEINPKKPGWFPKNLLALIIKVATSKI